MGWSWTPEMVSPTTSPSMRVILSPPPLSARLSVTSRRSFAMLPLTSSKKWPPLLPPPPLRSPMSFPTVKSSPSVTSVSVPLRPSSNLPSWEWNPAESTRLPTTPSCPEAPPYTPVLLIVCKRKSPLLPHPPLRSRSLLPQRGNTPSGSEVPSCLPFPPSNRCGSPSKSTTSSAHPLSTGNASNFSTNLLMQLFEFQLLNRLFFHCHLILVDSLYLHMQFNEIMKM